MMDLGTLGGDSSAAEAISDSGMVVGSSNKTLGATPHAFLWTQASGMRDLGTLGGTFSSAAALNNHGRVVRRSSIAGDLEARPYIWSAQSGMQDLTKLIPANSGWLLYSPVAINRYGQIAGNAARVSTPTSARALLLTPIMRTQLHTTINP